MTGKPDVLISVDLARVVVPHEITSYTYPRVGYGKRMVIYVVEETQEEGHLLEALVLEDGGSATIEVDP